MLYTGSAYSSIIVLSETFGQCYILVLLLASLKKGTEFQQQKIALSAADASVNSHHVPSFPQQSNGCYSGQQKDYLPDLTNG